MITTGRMAKAERKKTIWPTHSSVTCDRRLSAPPQSCVKVAGGLECLLVSGIDAVSEAGEDDPLDCSAPFEEVRRLGDCYLCRILDGIPVKPATDSRERYRPHPVFDRERKR